MINIPYINTNLRGSSSIYDKDQGQSRCCIAQIKVRHVVVMDNSKELSGRLFHAMVAKEDLTKDTSTVVHAMMVVATAHMYLDIAIVIEEDKTGLVG
ncbi:hypothetical protein L6452_14538 [Arctium lappa]|uniref:Uncharacterized protein n=1 Tax=Arctium lappa TaxID=4217 RepID=A0ACB9CLA7_ARCLA|nr:hypothetical protein L6452_14538 [Arctium lappa]